jgi:hypothetical protein
LVGLADPTWHRPVPPCHVTNPPQMQETHSQAFSTIDLKSVQQQRLE